VLGAILDPTDAIAATAIMRRLGVPRRIAIVLEGEALVNDATALVAYKIAVAAAVGESFSASHAGLEFLGVAAGGIAVGLLVGCLLAEIRKRLDDPATEATMSLFSGYAAFLPADQLGLSGVLATVACGLYLGYRAPELQGPQTRLRTQTLWEFLTFILNATLFVLIGLQLPVIVDGLKHTSFSTGQAIGYALLAALAVVAIRFIWGFGRTALLRAIDRTFTESETLDLAGADRQLLGRDARRGIAGRGARPAADDRFRLPVSRARPHSFRHLRRDRLHPRGPGIDLAGTDPCAAGTGGR
jgi:NhaP-type Na+/H+ or K+/H+ antiporter